MTVRPATGFDEAAALESWRLALDARGRPPSKARQAQARATLRAPLALTLVAEHEGRVVGMLLAEPSRSGSAVEPGVVQLSMLYVAPAFQRHGHGTALVEALLARYPAVRVEPTDESVDFFTRTGFRRYADQHISPALQADGATPAAVDHCDTCRFDASQWTRQDLTGTLPHLTSMAVHLAEGASYDVTARLAALLAPLAGPPPADDLTAVHQAWHLLSEAGRLRHALGEGAPAQTGIVDQVSVSAGGVPKQPVLRAAVTAGGVAGDRQASRKHHGRPWQAVCLWSAEVVDALAAEGHPIGYGCAGENLTLRGLDWAAVRPGVRLLVGSALVEVTAYAIPCQANARWFTDGDYRRLAHQVSPGTSRVYARVLVDGVVATGDAAILEPGPIPTQPVAPRQAAIF